MRRASLLGLAVAAAAASAPAAVAASGAPLATSQLAAPAPAGPGELLTGTPAVGQRLSCGAALVVPGPVAFGWWRDLHAIEGASASSYTVTAADAGHYLQCSATSSDGPVALSPFAAVPLTGTPRPVLASDTRQVSGAREPTASRGTTAPVVLAATPYMGWDSYYALGDRIDEAVILEQVRALVARGLARAGYRYVWLDFGWWNGRRDPAGQIVVNRRQWPHGLAWLARVLHHSGLRLGLYTDAGATGCGTPAGSYGHYQQDANTFAAWGVDAVKVDFCGGIRQHLDPGQAYSALHAAILANASHRPMLLSVCNFTLPGQVGPGVPSVAASSFGSWRFAPAIANAWRTNSDIGTPGHVVFASVLNNLDADATHPLAAGPGHWNDPDYLVAQEGLSAAAYRTQLSMWAILAAPLVVSDDLTTLSPASVADTTNPALISIDQDPAGVQGTLVAAAGAAEVWVRPLSDGTRAVALLNRGPVPLRISASGEGIGLARATRYSVGNVWSGRRSDASGLLSAIVAPEGTVLVRVGVAPTYRRSPR